ncbi:DNA-binding protein [Variovorax paradoxus]|nr:DNA-binding protein [Variovorax paradoxus]
MNSGTTGVSAFIAPVPVRRRGPRGVQLEEVVEAADVLLARGLKPTIERVRQQLGGGSPNTISPLLDVWYERLSARVAGVAVPVEDDLPPNLRSAWNHAKNEARTIANQALLEERAALEQGRAQLCADQAELAKREEQWVATTAAIEKALTETRDASEALRGELASAHGELGRLHGRYSTDVDKLQESLASERRLNETLRVEHARALEARKDTWQRERERLEAREIAHERRFLAEVDQARQSAKLLETELAKERKRQLQIGEEAAVERKTH